MAGALAAPHHLAQAFTARRRKWLGDRTDIDTAEGWLYLALVMDLFSRTIVGWAMAEHMQAELVAQALRMALGRRWPEAGLLHASDWGSQYTSHLIQALVAANDLTVSMSGVGTCYDNTPMESSLGP